MGPATGPQGLARSRPARPPRTAEGVLGILTPAPPAGMELASGAPALSPFRPSCCVPTGFPGLWGGLLPRVSVARVGAACLASAAPHAPSPFFPPAPSRLLRRRPAWYDLPPPPYSSDTESLNQADLPPYRSRSGSADSASSQAASSLLSVEDAGPSPGQPGPAEGVAEPRDSVPSRGTEQV